MSLGCRGCASGTHRGHKHRGHTSMGSKHGGQVSLRTSGLTLPSPLPLVSNRFTDRLTNIGSTQSGRQCLACCVHLSGRLLLSPDLAPCILQELSQAADSSCKGRGVCPSCNTRRMAETAAHLVDHVLPRLPVRQWGEERAVVQWTTAALRTAGQDVWTGTWHPGRFLGQRARSGCATTFSMTVRPSIPPCASSSTRSSATCARTARAPDRMRAPERWPSSTASAPRSTSIPTFTSAPSTAYSSPMQNVGCDDLSRSTSWMRTMPRRYRPGFVAASCAHFLGADCSTRTTARRCSHGATAADSPWMQPCASKRMTGAGASGCCVIVPDRLSPRRGSRSWIGTG
jgi:hypothetical protein